MKKRRKMMAESFGYAKYIIWGGEIFINLAAHENAPILARFIWKIDAPSPVRPPKRPIPPPQS